MAKTLLKGTDLLSEPQSPKQKAHSQDQEEVSQNGTEE